MIFDLTVGKEWYNLEIDLIKNLNMIRQFHTNILEETYESS